MAEGYHAVNGDVWRDGATFRPAHRRPVGENEVLAVLSPRGDGGGAKLLARVTHRSGERLGFREDAQVHAQVKSVALAPPRQRDGKQVASIAPTIRQSRPEDKPSSLTG